jgi:hypothetical protein
VLRAPACYSFPLSQAIRQEFLYGNDAILCTFAFYLENVAHLATFAGDLLERVECQLCEFLTAKACTQGQPFVGT